MDCIGCQATLYMGFSKQKYWSGLPFPTPGDIPDPGDWNCISCIGKWMLYHWAIREAQLELLLLLWINVTALTSWLFYLLIFGSFQTLMKKCDSYMPGGLVSQGLDVCVERRPHTAHGRLLAVVLTHPGGFCSSHSHWTDSEGTVKKGWQLSDL